MNNAACLFGNVALLVALLLFSAVSQAQTLLLDFGNDNSFRGVSVQSPDVNGNYWNSLQTGLYYENLVDIHNSTTAIDFGFSTGVATDSYNGPAGVTMAPVTPAQIAATDINSSALGSLGVAEAAFDYVAGGPGAVRFELQQLDPAKSYDLSFFGSHKYSTDSETVYSVYSDNTYTTLVDSVSLSVQNPGDASQHNRDQVATLNGISPQASNNLYIEFVGGAGNQGYLNSLSLSPAQPVQPDSQKVYMHYMPWFDTPEVLGGNNWGIHWKMNTQNPNIVDSTGKRQIASHYYPKIGPYQSSNDHVIEYHMLLMKMAGVDGVLIDWYGVQGTNGDITNLLNNSNAIVNKTDDFGMEFGVVLEDRFSADINQAKANLAYLRDNYFNKPEYIRINDDNDPLLGVFGPITFEQESEWTQILAEAGEPVDFHTLWYESTDAGANADGEYAWIYEEEELDNYLNHLANFYKFRAPTLNSAGGIAFPGFEDFYEEGGWGSSFFEIPHEDGQTLANTLLFADQYSEDYEFLQLATWNDFGEGTIFEPTVETGFEYLLQLQQFTGVEFGEEELQMVYRLYLAREKYSGDTTIQNALDQVSSLIATLDVTQAASLLDTFAPLGDYDGDGDVDADDYIVWHSTFGTETILYGSGADGNFDGVVDAADYTIWLAHLTSNGAGASGAAIPEPASVFLLGLGCMAIEVANRRSR